jgi:hypothetical protein
MPLVPRITKGARPTHGGRGLAIYQPRPSRFDDRPPGARTPHYLRTAVMAQPAGGSFQREPRRDSLTSARANAARRRMPAPGPAFIPELWVAEAVAEAREERARAAAAAPPVPPAPAIPDPAPPLEPVGGPRTLVGW